MTTTFEGLSAGERSIGPRFSKIGQLLGAVYGDLGFAGFTNGTFKWFRSVVAAPFARFSS